MTLIVREAVCLKLADRQYVDRKIASDPAQLEGLGDLALVASIKKLSAMLDPASVVARNRRAFAERHVTCRPAPDTMCYLTALLPVAQGVAVHAALLKAADSKIANGESRGRFQLMAVTSVSARLQEIKQCASLTATPYPSLPPAPSAARPFASGFADEVQINLGR